MKLTKPKIALLAVACLLAVVAAVVLYYYSQGSREHYVPPVAEALPVEAQALNDLTTLLKAMEAYYSVNLKYPDKLEDLQPDFIAKLPADPTSTKPYKYETDGSSGYKISVGYPASLHLKVLAVDNGKIIRE